jgi:hypothetical protein
MKARIKQNVGVLGLSFPVAETGQVIEVEPFIGPYGDVCPGLFKGKHGVWKEDLLVFVEEEGATP